MSNTIKCLFLLLCALHFSFAQNKDQVLLKVNDKPVMVSEFLRVYNKNLDLVQDESQKDIDGYLKLFTEYQLKLQEAMRLKLHEDEKYLREFSRYQKQLIQNYISENEVTDALVREAYDRSNYDLKASHILVRLDASEKDTIHAYNQVLKLREKVLKEGFENVQKEMHDGKDIFIEDLGYFSAFKMVYEFETAAYNTAVGEISMPFRTQFGYHVVKVNDRRKSKGTITAAHIMVSLKSEDSLTNPEDRINDIYKKLNQGESFDALAKQFSDDKSSAKNGGKLMPFKSGQLSSLEFENVAFSLTENGEVSGPFKTAFGWHIVKRIDLQPIESFEDLKSTFEQQVKRDSRSKLINEAMVNKLKEKYNIIYNSKSKAYFTALINEDFFNRSWILPEDLKKEEIVFTINDRGITYEDFGKHLVSAQRLYTNRSMPASVVIDQEYEKLFEKSIFQYREDNLETENPEYANILSEYRDGLLLFDLMEKEVWNKASKDTVGLKNYFEAHKANYQWDDRVEVLIASFVEKDYGKSIRKMMKKGKSVEEIKNKLNKDNQQNVIFTKGVYNTNDDILPSAFIAKKGVSDVYEHNEAYHIIDVIRVLPARLKTLDEAKGNVINDYQAEIEQNWINDLYKRFKIEVNQDVLNTIKAEIGN